MIRSFHADRLRVLVYGSAAELGKAAARSVAEAIAHVPAPVRVVFATGNSQLPFVEALAGEPIDWNRVHAFHLDEYVGLDETHPASFRRWIRERIEERLRPARTHYLSQPERYAELVAEAPIELACIGIGENGHIAFNDPGVADFNDPLTVKAVELDEACRRQQVGEGHFATLEDVPRQALTMTCPAIMSARQIICCVPERRKATAVRNTLLGPIDEACPASILRRHASAVLYLDADSASLL